MPFTPACQADLQAGFRHGRRFALFSTSDLEIRPFCMRNMLPNATFAEILAIDKNSIVGISPSFGEVCVSCTYKHAL